MRYCERRNERPVYSPACYAYCQWVLRTQKWKFRLWDGSKVFIHSSWIFYAMCSLVPVRHFRNISGHLFTRPVCGSFRDSQWRHGLMFTDWIVWDDKDEVIGFKRSHWIRLGCWSTGSPKLRLFQIVEEGFTVSVLSINSVEISNLAFLAKELWALPKMQVLVELSVAVTGSFWVYFTGVTLYVVDGVQNHSSCRINLHWRQQNRKQAIKNDKIGSS